RRSDPLRGRGFRPRQARPTPRSTAGGWPRRWFRQDRLTDLAEPAGGHHGGHCPDEVAAYLRGRMPHARYRHADFLLRGETAEKPPYVLRRFCVARGKDRCFE